MPHNALPIGAALGCFPVHFNAARGRFRAALLPDTSALQGLDRLCTRYIPAPLFEDGSSVPVKRRGDFMLVGWRRYIGRTECRERVLELISQANFPDSAENLKVSALVIRDSLCWSTHYHRWMFDLLRKPSRISSSCCLLQYLWLCH